MLGEDLVVDDLQFHIPEVHADIGDLEDGGIVVFDRSGFYDLERD